MRQMSRAENIEAEGAGPACVFCLSLKRGDVFFINEDRCKIVKEYNVSFEEH